MAKKLASDKALFTVVVLLVAFGLVMVFSASAALARGAGGATANPYLIKQGLAAGIGVFAMLAAMHVDYRTWKRPLVVYAGLAAVVALLAAVLMVGPVLNGTRRWFVLGPLSVQPSELAKLALVPFVAYHLEKKADRVNRPELLLPVGIATALVAGLVLLGPDLGTAALLVACVLLMVFLAGLRWRTVLLGGAVLLPLGLLAILGEPYRRQRLLAFLDPEADPLGAGYQVLQSLIAVGSGGLFGVGLGNSGQKLFFLPYPHSDFIYAIVAEELGFVGALAVLALFAVLLWRGTAAALHAPDAFGRYLGLGLTGILVLQALINVSVAVSLLPTKGIPLPFLSYGGSSLVVSMAACGVLLNLSEHAS
jgi:cell division protein FtsW